MNKGKVFFNPIDGSAPLSISWCPGPKGDAVEAPKGMGVGFFSAKGDLLGVIFDDVSDRKDHQILEFEHYRVEVLTKQGKVFYSVFPVESKKIHPKAGRKKSAA